ncbi:hypothetical protein TNIN_259741 [Trichonephila inaurata madagascariensis]|uniref:Uncharacterized protein n=1 Tax=Trichonephila inaurata madagascariensis TaxID=2747483 RepID=A0A8X7BSF0_9ARAC|nr:hypothetical protein TNIN_259741 [Trichonephila inaurata madagascariensis]
MWPKNVARGEKSTKTKIQERQKCVSNPMFIKRDVWHAYPLLAYLGTGNREATLSVPATNHSASYPSHITGTSSRVFPQTIASSPAYFLPPSGLHQAPFTVQ